MSRSGLTRRSFLAGTAIAASSAALGSRVANGQTGEEGNAAAPDSSAPVVAKPGGIRFGVTARQAGEYQEIVDFWQEAESIGYDTAFVYDHFMGPTPGGKGGCCYDGWALLPGLAAQTKRIRLGTLVTGNTFRHPAILAKSAATVDHISGGRLILGIGAGWMEREHIAFGIPYGTPGERARRLVESVELIKMLFTQETSTYEGKYYSLKDAPFIPKPLQKPHPPILIGGMGPKIVQPLVARHAQIWHFGVPGNDPVKAKALIEHFDGVCREVGRDPAEIEKTTSLNAMKLRKKPVEEMRREIRDLVALGVRHFVLLPPPAADYAVIRTFAEEVMPEFRTG